MSLVKPSLKSHPIGLCLLELAVTEDEREVESEPLESPFSERCQISKACHNRKKHTVLFQGVIYREGKLYQPDFSINKAKHKKVVKPKDIAAINVAPKKVSATYSPALNPALIIAALNAHSEKWLKQLDSMPMK